MAKRPARPLARQFVVVALVLALGWVLFIRAPGPGTLGDVALGAASDAGCDDLERPVLAEPGGDHLSPGESFAYPDPPAAAGPHDPSPLPADPHVRAEPASETRAVHNLEHAYVLIWYRPATEGGLGRDVVDALEGLAAGEDRVIMAPYPDLPEDRALALVAWNTRWLCPAGATAGQAVAIARGFIDAYRGTTNAPEAPRGLLGPLLVD
ncbi:MAG: DUF3105 domain-containing protein [Actinomycetota bacterium]